MSAFVDHATLFLSAGNGGDGCVSVRREKFKPLGGPDGGNGGDGGSVILIADPQTSTLLEYQRRPHRKATNGGPGAGDLREGSKGEDLIIPVPVGTVLKSESDEILADLEFANDTFIAAKGGLGGLGNAGLASAKRKAPGFALLGTLGDELTLRLELKTIADVALVGFPSAGKSSLIAAISAAKPKIADYPFTTLRPNLGVVEVQDYRYVVADVPGLIEGASEGKGLGLEFLRHVERCSVLLHVIDCATIEPDRDPLSDLEVILRELEAYQVADEYLPLLERPQLIALNKIDVPEARELADFIKPELEELGYKVFEVSAATREGLRDLTIELGVLVEKHRTQNFAEAEVQPVIKLKGPASKRDGFVIKREGGSYGPIYRILGVKPERWVEQTDFSNDEAVGYLADRLQKIGIDSALTKAGAEAGATVVIGPGSGVVFDWEPTLTSAAEVQVGSRGSDPRIDPHERRTTAERRAEYQERMDAKTLAREELESEREAGLWSGDEQI
ncbi:MAG TPA: GTPase ObgE [Microbacteriaceae bacterium]|nr:GTPase ObgE [Microbacteriaceae bacterium]